MFNFTYSPNSVRLNHISLISMKKKGSLLLTVLGILFILFGCINFLSIFLYSLAIISTLSLIYWIIYGVLFIITGAGILLLKSWARLLAVALVGIKMIQLTVGSIQDINIMVKKSVESIVIAAEIGLTIVFLGIGGGIIYYLASTKVKEKFQ